MWIAIIALASVVVAAIGFIIWTRTQINKLHVEIKKLMLERDMATRSAELAKINLTTAKASLKAEKGAKTRAQNTLQALRKEYNDVLELIAKGELTDSASVKSKLDSLLSQ